MTVYQLAQYITHQRTVKIGQPPISVNERNRRNVLATDNLSIFGLSIWHDLSRISAP